jgi:CRP-like cAMP-binding protein
MSEGRFKNTVLRHLTPETIRRLNLRKADLEVNQELEHPGRPVRQIVFLEAGIGSMTTSFIDGSQVEVGMFGYESAIGVSALMGGSCSLNRVSMQLAGWGFASAVNAARAEFERCADFQRRVLRYVQAQLLEAAQLVGCNARHPLQQRLARWLLICADRANTTRLPLSQQYLSHMLGVTRTSVSATAGRLKEEGLIDYKRSVISLKDRKALERKACECYEVVRRQFDHNAEPDLVCSVSELVKSIQGRRLRTMDH